MNLVISDNIRILCLSYSIENPKQLPNCLKRAGKGVVLIVFYCVFWEVCTYTVTVSYHCSTWISYKKNYI